MRSSHGKVTSDGKGECGAVGACVTWTEREREGDDFVTREFLRGTSFSW